MPENYEQLRSNFREYVARQTISIFPDSIGNMDKIPVAFDLPRWYTFDFCGKEDIEIAITGKNNRLFSYLTLGSERSCFTVLLAVMADRTKCLPMIIFKRKTIPKNLPDDFFFYQFYCLHL